MDHLGHLYDLHYNVINELDSQTHDNAQKQTFYLTLLALANEKPVPDDFDSYFEYEQSLVEWKIKADRILDKKHLPVPVGRYFYRKHFSIDSYKATLNRNNFTGDTGEKKDIEVFSDKKLDYDPWNTLLIPVEPNPDDYMTFKDFEAAYLKWATLCSQLKIIPPHTHQLQEMIPIKEPNANDPSSDGRDTLLPAHIESQRKLGLVYLSFWERDLSLYDMIAAPPKIKFKDNYHFEQVYLDKAVFERILAGFDRLYEASQKYLKQNTYTKQILPKIMGIRKRKDGIRNDFVDEVKCRNDVLRRTDLSDDDIRACNHCSILHDERDIEYSIPNYDLACLEYKKLSDRSLLQTAKKNLIRLQFHDINNPLYSWYYPGRVEFHDKKNIHLKDLLPRLETQRHFTHTELYQFFNQNIYLDEFTSLLEEVIETQEGKSLSCTDVLLKMVNKTSIYYLLDQLETTSDRLVHSKISAFIYSAFHTPTFKEIMDEVLLNSDISKLSLITYAMSFFEITPLDLFPYRESIVQVALHLIGKKYAPIIDCLYRYYYLGIIKRIVTNQAYHFTSTSRQIIQIRKDITSELISLLRSNLEFLHTHLLRGISNRSKHVSAFFLFMCIQLLRDDENHGVMQDILLQESTNLIGNINILLKSKLSHTRFAGKRFIAIFQSSEEWNTLILDRCSKSESLLQDIFDPCLVHPEYSEFLLQTINTGIQNAIVRNGVSSVYWLVNNTTFHKLMASINDNSFNDSTYLYKVKLLNTIIKGCSKMNSIRSFDFRKTVSHTTIMVTPKIVEDLINLLKKCTFPTAEMTNACCALFLSIIRHMMKSSQVFELMKFDTIIHSNISNYCSHPDPDCSKEPWKLFYQIIKYHKGNIEPLASKNIITLYFEKLSIANSQHASRNALHYLNKIYSLPLIDTRKTGGTKMKVQPDLKHLNMYLTRCHMFIKIHFMCKKLIETKSGVFFYELIEFYSKLMTEPNLKKLLREVQKNEEFKEAAQKINSLSLPPKKKKLKL